MRVLHVITALHAGGAERELAELASRTENDVEVVTLKRAGSLAEDIRRSGVRVTDMQMKHSRDASVIPRLVQIMAKGHFDVVHGHLFRACLYGGVAAAIARVPRVVITEHSLGNTQIEERKLNRQLRLLYKLASTMWHRTIAVSPAVERRLHSLGIPSDKVVVIPNGIDLERFRFAADQRDATRERLDIPEDAFVLGTVGRLARVKRHDMLLRAAAPLLRRQDRLMIVGNGAQRRDLERVASELRISEQVIFTGAANDVPAALAAMDAFASASHEETFGLSVVEALANGLRVVATTCPALEDVGKVPEVTLARDVSSLRAALGQIWGGTRQGQAADVVQRFDISEVVAAIDCAYEDLFVEIRDRATSTTKFT